MTRIFDGVNGNNAFEAFFSLHCLQIPSSLIYIRAKNREKLLFKATMNSHTGGSHRKASPRTLCSRYGRLAVVILFGGFFMVLLLRKQPQLRSPVSSSASSIASSSSSLLKVFKKAPLLDGSKTGEEIKRIYDSSLPSSLTQVRLFYSFM